MKTTNLKNILLIIIEVLFVFAIGAILNILNFVSWINMIIYILLMFEILWAVKVSYSKYDISSNNACILSFVLLIVINFLCKFIIAFIQIPYTYLASYMFIIGFLACDGFLMIFKHNKHLIKYKLWPSVFRIIGIIYIIISMLGGILSLFGLAKYH